MSGSVPLAALQTFSVGTRFRGPAAAANGGYVSGLLADALGMCAAEVNLRAPTPLETRLEMRRASDCVCLMHDHILIAEARPSVLQLDIPPCPSLSEAAQATQNGDGTESPFPECFACGRRRPPGDGLGVFAGGLAGSSLVAAAWQPHHNFARPDGTLAPQFAWAALDCPGGFAASEGGKRGACLTVRMHGEILRPMPVGRPYIVLAWPVWRDGRKTATGTALFDAYGQVTARALSLWLQVPQAR